MEVIGGARTKAKRSNAARLMQSFIMIFPERVDLEWAMQAQMQYELSHGVGMLDCLIAAPCLRLQTPLYTRNLKHFRPLLNQQAQSPY
jgi:predicted nucleic acid-binding protein